MQRKTSVRAFSHCVHTSAGLTLQGLPLNFPGFSRCIDSHSPSVSLLLTPFVLLIRIPLGRVILIDLRWGFFLGGLTRVSLRGMRSFAIRHSRDTLAVRIHKGQHRRLLFKKHIFFSFVFRSIGNSFVSSLLELCDTFPFIRLNY
jgi:hypothetical protein